MKSTDREEILYVSPYLQGKNNWQDDTLDMQSTETEKGGRKVDQGRKPALSEELSL